MFEDPKDFPLTEESLYKLQKVDRDLETVLLEAKTITDLNFQVLEGKRTVTHQEMLWYKGESSHDVMSSYTLGKSVTLGIYIADILCLSWDIYCELASCIRYAAQNKDIAVGWSSVCLDLRDVQSESMEDIIRDSVEIAGTTKQSFRFIPQHFWVPA